MNQQIEGRNRRTQWMMQDRFGMFIHWGLYAIPARGEWIKSHKQITDEEYQNYFDEFDPVDYDPKEWARLAKEAGMKYAVLTTKHHDGFCLFDSALTDYKATNTKAGRDLVREYVDAFRAEGLKIGFYYSLLDWHHPDYPHYGDRYHPMRENEAWKGREHHLDNYVKYLHGQVKELCTNYGKIDIMWFDFSYDDMSDETWKAKELVEMIRSYQPDVIIDNRLEANCKATMLTTDPASYSGDFAAPEQMIPPEGIVDQQGNPVPWEACLTVNDRWGYYSGRNITKPARLIIRNLVDCCSKGGNMLLNVGPDAKGRIPQDSVNVLKEVGQWLKINGESIYGCGSAGLPKPEWGRFTKKGNKIYAHVTEESVGFYGVKLPYTIKKIRRLQDGSEIKPHEAFNTEGFPDYVFFELVDWSYNPLSDPFDTVVEFEVE